MKTAGLVHQVLGFLSAHSQTEFLRSAAVLAGGVALGRLIVVLASPVITRLYTPDDMGRLGTFLAFINVASVATCLRYDVAIVSAKTPREAAYLAVTGIAFTVPMGILATVALQFMMARSIVGFGILPAYSGALVLPALLLTLGFVVLRYHFIREGNFALISKVTVLQNGVRTLFQLGLGLLGAGWAGLLWGDLAGRAFGLGRMARLGGPTIIQQILPLKLREVLAVLATYRKFPLYSLPSSLIDVLSLSLAVPLLAQLYGSAPAGQMLLVQVVFALPLALVGGTVADVFHSRMAIYAREEPGRARPFFLKTATTLFLVGLGPIAFLGLMGPTLFKWVYGGNWMTAGFLAAAMAPWALAQLVVSPLSQVVFVFQGQELKLVYDVMHLIVVVGVLFLGHDAGLSVIEVVRVLSLVQVLIYSFYFLLLWRIVPRSG